MARRYEVELLVKGAITPAKSMSFNTQKELNLGAIFLSDVAIKNHNRGFSISVTVFTESSDRANKVALLFIGKMLDVLSFKIDSALNVTLESYSPILNRSIVRAIVTKEEFIQCFELSREFNLNHDKILRSLSWYRKGLYTEDPFDKFLAFWNVLTIIGEHYYDKENERARLGTINKIWNCFEILWGAPQNWPHIPQDGDWINRMADIRNSISHAGIMVDIDTIQRVISELDRIQKVSYSFLEAMTTHINMQVI